MASLLRWLCFLCFIAWITAICVQKSRKVIYCVNEYRFAEIYPQVETLELNGGFITHHTLLSVFPNVKLVRILNGAWEQCRVVNEEFYVVQGCNQGLTTDPHDVGSTRSTRATTGATDSQPTAPQHTTTHETSLEASTASRTDHAAYTQHVTQQSTIQDLTTEPQYDVVGSTRSTRTTTGTTDSQSTAPQHTTAHETNLETVRTSGEEHTTYTEHATTRQQSITQGEETSTVSTVAAQRLSDTESTNIYDSTTTDRTGQSLYLSTTKVFHSSAHPSTKLRDATSTYKSSIKRPTAAEINADDDDDDDDELVNMLYIEIFVPIAGSLTSAAVVFIIRCLCIRRRRRRRYAVSRINRGNRFELRNILDQTESTMLTETTQRTSTDFECIDLNETENASTSTVLHHADADQPTDETTSSSVRPNFEGVSTSTPIKHTPANRLSVSTTPPAVLGNITTQLSFSDEPSNRAARDSVNLAVINEVITTTDASTSVNEADYRATADDDEDHDETLKSDAAMSPNISAESTASLPDLTLQDVATDNKDKAGPSKPPFECSVCQRLCASKAGLVSHQRVHAP